MATEKKTQKRQQVGAGSNLEVATPTSEELEQDATNDVDESVKDGSSGIVSIPAGAGIGHPESVGPISLVMDVVDDAASGDEKLARRISPDCQLLEKLALVMAEAAVDGLSIQFAKQLATVGIFPSTHDEAVKYRDAVRRLALIAEAVNAEVQQAFLSKFDGG